MPRGSGKNGQPKQGSSGLQAYMPQGSAAGSGSQVGGEANWGWVDASTISRAVVAVTRTGGAILFGKSRKMDSYAITLYNGGAHNTFYWYGDEEAPTKIHSWLEGLIYNCDQEVELM